MKYIFWFLVFFCVANAVHAQTVTLNCVVADGSVPPPVVVDAGVDAGPPPVIDAGPPPSTNRPSASRGKGFYVVGRNVYDGNGQPFTMRGTNKTHQDNWGPGLGHTKSNTTRWLVYFVDEPERTIADMQSSNIGGSTTFGQAAQVPGYWDGTCKSDTATFDNMVNRWVRDAKKYQTFEKYMVLNIANEWGDDPVKWRDAYVSAIPRIRNAGWHGAIMVDAPGCGQNAKAIVDYGRAVFAADVEQNVLFDWHIYGNVCDVSGGVACQWNGQLDLGPTMDQLYATGLTVIVGEFGPGRNIGPSPTMITPQRVIDVAEAHSFGWLSWSWEDNDKSGAQCSNSSFCHVFDTLSASIAPSNLTDFGKIMVAQWEAKARPASIFATAGVDVYLYGSILTTLLLLLLILWLLRRKKKKPQTL